MEHKRRAGILAHISSLPTDHGIGDLGPSAHEFARIASRMGLSSWQLLPLTPIDGGCGWSPYSSPSAFAGNVLFVSPELLERDGLVSSELVRETELPRSATVDYERAAAAKRRLLATAHENFRADDAYKDKFRRISDKFWQFCYENAWWLEDYALFTVLKGLSGGAPWNEWRPEFRDRDWTTLDPLKRTKFVARELDRVRFEQFIFFSQLAELRELCADLGIELIGDVPIYTAFDSADVWGHRELFAIDAECEPIDVAGVPPDYFCETGQRWGNPLYRWDVMRDDGWGWWIGRISQALKMTDRVRIDHFRGLLAYWAVPTAEETAINGEWRDGPGRGFLEALRDKFASDGVMPFIAEDLGIITDDVREAMDDFGLPGMKVLQFAFGEGMPKNPYAPHNHRRGCVVYCGTHDNDTTLGWWLGDATKAERANFAAYIGRDSIPSLEVPREMLRLAMSSTADTVIFTAQDALGLGSEARMNRPSTAGGNWSWRMESLAPLSARSNDIRELAEFYGRAPSKADEEEE